MDIIEIIKDAFVFPSKDLKLLLIYELLSIVAAVFLTIGILVYVLGFVNPECFLWGGIAVIISMVIGWVLSGYLISIIKSGMRKVTKSMISNSKSKLSAKAFATRINNFFYVYLENLILHIISKRRRIKNYSCIYIYSQFLLYPFFNAKILLKKDILNQCINCYSEKYLLYQSGDKL